MILTTLTSLALAASAATKTPIKHLVVIFQENVSFDHYFATYPGVNGLSEVLREHNPNAAQPKRLGPANAATCDQDHTYGAEQKAYHGGLMDKFVESTGADDPGCDPKIVLDYFDGETIPALWSYARHFTLSDNFYDTTFGPSTPGAINLVSGQTHGVVPPELKIGDEIIITSGTLISDADPEFDDCSDSPTLRMTGVNIGDRMNEAGVTWGFFEGGFRPTAQKEGRAVCGDKHKGADGKDKKDYIPHHEPFQYYKTTANPHHLPPSATAKIGRDDQANHQYDLDAFWLAAEAGYLPQVSYLKAPAFQDGHAGYSDPVNEQRFLVAALNRLQKLKEWKEMAVIVTYDDSDGWYDHVMPPIVNQSSLPGIDSCGAAAPGAYPGRCGYGPRLPFLLISPYAKRNYVDHEITDQTSILRFIEENWGVRPIGDQSFDAKAGPLDGMFDFSRKTPAPKLILDAETGKPRP